jgi:putative hydrolase of HD superfamily
MYEPKDLEKILEFFRIAIRMKETYRFTPKRENGYENDAEHSWSVVMLCMLLTKRVQDDLNVELDINKVLKMATIHDLAEVIAGDTKTWDSKARISKEENEKLAMEEMLAKLPKDLSDEFLSLWKECEAKSTVEAKIVKSIDRLEPVLHRVLLGYGWENLGDEDPEKTVKALDNRQLERHGFSSVLMELYQDIRGEALEKGMLS